MTKKIIILISIFINVCWARSQSYDTTQFRLDKEKLRRDSEAAKKGDLKRAELNLNDWTIESEKSIKLKKPRTNKLCTYSYKNFKFLFDYEQFLKSLNASTGYYVVMKEFRVANSQGDTIDISKFVLKAGDENFVVEHLIKLISEKNLLIYDKENKPIEKVILKSATWETATNKGEVTLFYINNSYLFYRNERICTSKRFQD